MAFLSIVMSVYNEEKNVENAILSIMAQTYENWEFIILDDGSTDHTLEVIERVSAKDDRIKLLKNEGNFGLAYSLNKGISYSRGDYIVRMDADDVSLPNRLECQLTFLEKNADIDVLGAAAYYTKKPQYSENIVILPESHDEILSNIFKKCPFIHSSVMMRRSFLKETGGYNNMLRRAQDYDLWLRGQFTGRYHNLQLPLIRYNFKRKIKLKDIFAVLQIKIHNAKKKTDIFYAVFWSVYELSMLIWYVSVKR